MPELRNLRVFDVDFDTSKPLLRRLHVQMQSTLIVYHGSRETARLTGGLGETGDRIIRRLTLTGARGQFLVGLLLGLVWSPCAGPTLGAASLLAAQRNDLMSVATVMLAFGVGTTLPMLLVAMRSAPTVESPTRAALPSIGSNVSFTSTAAAIRPIAADDPAKLSPAGPVVQSRRTSAYALKAP